MKNKISRIIMYICLSIVFVGAIFSEEYEYCYISLGIMICDLLIDIRSIIKEKFDILQILERKEENK